MKDYTAHFLLILINDLQHCLVNKLFPNYLISQCNMLEHLSEDTVMLHACKLSSVRSDPSEHLQMVIEHIKAPTEGQHYQHPLPPVGQWGPQPAQ
ncbi:protein MB21D2 [Crotalus adamanteus]|uniref:Protein MB21D2 n=1 Tax=Crotalus adamanteus TaxID=8729 RepID=A0AAW1B587_CROAD